MTESTLIKAEEASVFVDKWEDEGKEGVWLSIQTRCGGAHCVIPASNIPEMIEALQAALKEQA